MSPKHGVGIIGHNHPYWFVSGIGAVFAGGLSCGIYTTSSADTVKYICQHAPLDILVLQDGLMLEQLLQKESGIGQIVKKFILMDGNNVGQYDNVLTWEELLESGKLVSDEVLKEKEDQQAANEACLLIYTSGTTGPPKGNLKTDFSSHFSQVSTCISSSSCND